jgi:hypothetical protein
MSFREKLNHEVKALAQAMLYFGAWAGGWIVLKTLTLEEYQIQFHGVSLALVSALILAKVVLVLEHVPLGNWILTRPAWMDVLLRTILYSLGVLVVLVLEKAFEGRREHGGFSASLNWVIQHKEIHHILANGICMSGALLGYNALSVARRHLGPGGLLHLYLSPLPLERKSK